LRFGAITGTMRGMGIRLLRERVEEAVRAGDSLDEIQTEIVDSAPLPDEMRDALWLYAWGLLEQDHDPALN
jgi:hypothetical protein